jgi:hypothetical protein
MAHFRKMDMEMDTDMDTDMDNLKRHYMPKNLRVLKALRF